MVHSAGAEPDAQVKIATDTAGWIKAVSPGFLALIGRPVETLARVNVIDLVHPHDAAVARELMTRVETNAAPTDSVELRIFGADDSWQVMQLRVNASPDGRIAWQLAPLSDPLRAAADPGPTRGSLAPPAPDASETEQRTIIDRTDLHPAPQLADGDLGALAEGDRGALADGDLGALAEGDLGALAKTETDGRGRTPWVTHALAVVGGVATYLALQGLYLGPSYGWPSPAQGLLRSNECRIRSLCENGVLQFNHLGVFSLLVAIVAFTGWFVRRVDRRQLDRPAQAAVLTSTSWKPTLRGPGAFAWLAVLAVAAVSAQTVFTDSVSPNLWIAATALGAIAAWRSDGSAGRGGASTLAAISVALSCLLIPLGIGTIWLGEYLKGMLVLAAGLAVFLWALHLQKRSAATEGPSSFDRLDYVAMLGFSILALVLGLARHRSWRYAFIGDEWTFYESARDGITGNPTLDTFGIGGTNDYYTGLTFELQGSVMRIAGGDVFGWRLSALLPLVVSVAAMYAFTRWLGGRAAALGAAAALATGHVLLSFSMAPYNSSQALVAVSFSFAALAWAHQRPSALRFFLLGSTVGSTFLVFALARLALLPLGILFLALFRHDLAAFRRRLGWATLGGVAMAAPALFSAQNWQGLLKATPVQAEDPVLAQGGLGRQVVENAFDGWLSFIGSTANSHYIVGPHLDVLSAVLLIVGVGYTFARSRTDIAMRWFAVGGIGLWTVINVIQQYAEVSNTRSFMIPLVYCVFVGLGASAFAHRLRRRDSRGIPNKWLGTGAFVILSLALLGLNQVHIDDHANERQRLTEQAVLIEQFQLTESQDGQGMPVYVAWVTESNARLTTILRAHDIAAERMVILGPNETLNRAALCAETEPVMLVVHNRYPEAPELAQSMARCWGQPAVEATNPAGGAQLLRVSNAAGSTEFDADRSDRFRRGAQTADYSLDAAMDVAVDGDGVAFALTRDSEGTSIHRLDGGGSFALAQGDPIDFDITSDGLFVVASNGGHDRLVWYDGAGNPVRRYGGQSEIASIGGVTVAGDRVWISDTTRSRVLAFDGSFALKDIRVAQGTLSEPASVAPGPDGALWIYSARTGEIALVDSDDRVVTRLPAQVRPAINVPRLSSTNEGSLVRTIPDRPVVELVLATGEVIDSRGGTHKPRAATTRNGELLVVDPRWNDVAVLAIDERWAPRSDRGVINWNQAAPPADVAVYESAFASAAEEEFAPALELVDTEAISTADAQTWRSIGANILGEMHAIGVLPDGAIIADLRGHVVRLDSSGGAIESLTLSRVGEMNITDVAVDQAGAAWFLDAAVGHVRVVQEDGPTTVIDTMPFELTNARGIGLGADDSVWIAATASEQLLRMDAAGQVLATVRLPGRQPSDVLEAPDGTLWVIDAQETSLVHLTATGDLIDDRSLAMFSSGESPHLALDGDNVWVSHPNDSQVFAVDARSGELVGEPIELVRPDGSRVEKPVGIAVDQEGRLWLVDSRGGAVIIVDRG